MKVINQVSYPGAGDVDDCWVVATVIAVLDNAEWEVKPSITWARGAANDPDDGDTDGGTIDETYRMAKRIWRDIPKKKLRNANADTVLGLVKKGWNLSAAVLSSELPAEHRFGFNGLHQVAMEWDEGFRLANPLAKDGSDARSITMRQIKRACTGFTGRTNTISGLLVAPRNTCWAARRRYTEADLDAAIVTATENITDQLEAANRRIAAVAAAIDAAKATLTDEIITG